MYANYHTHTWRCNHARGTERDYIEQAIASGVKILGFSDHTPNPYSWNMDFLPYPDGSGYEARFYRCGICTLMKELGLQEYIAAMCRLDYPMTEAGGASDFIREYTLASGGPYCDCGYRKKAK